MMRHDADDKSDDTFWRYQCHSMSIGIPAVASYSTESSDPARIASQQQIHYM